jgi:hypothetical protein
MESQFNAPNPKAWVKFPRGPSSCKKNPEAMTTVIRKKVRTRFAWDRKPWL